MNAEAVKWVFEWSPYGGNQLLLHLAIAKEVKEDDRGNCFSLDDEYLAVRTGCSLRNVQRMRKQMVDDWFLELINDKRRPWETNLYRFLMPTGQEVEPQKPQPGLVERYAALDDEDVRGLFITVVLARVWMSTGDMGSAERALFGVRHTLDLAEITTVESIKEKRRYRTLNSEYLSLRRIINTLVDHRNLRNLPREKGQAMPNTIDWAIETLIAQEQEEDEK